MLALLQAAIRAAPAPVHVIVDRVPEGLSELAKTLIAAGVGAVFAIAVSIAMEFVKPQIVKQLNRKEIESQLAQELTDNLHLLDELILWINSNCLTLGGNERWVAALETINMSLAGTGRDRYDHYLANQKVLLYEIDDTQTLARFYRNLRAISLWRPPDKPLGFAQMLNQICAIGHDYLAFKGIPYKPKIVNLIEDHQRVLKDAEQK
jgi:hypothetical protein